MSMHIEFPGGLAVEAQYKGFTILTDQPEHAGGGGAAPAPFDLFLASLGTCAGLYALRFCQRRNIDTRGLGLSLATEVDTVANRLETVRLEISLPDSFPDKYRDAIVRAVEQCAVKQVISDPPRVMTAVMSPATEPVAH
jgi:putative redox protein